MRRLSLRLLIGCLLLAAASTSPVVPDAACNTQAGPTAGSPGSMRVVPTQASSIRDRVIELPRPSVGRVPGARPA